MRFSGILSFFLLLNFTLYAEEPPELVLQAGHQGSINALAISPDGKWLISAGQDSTIKIWSLQTGILLRTLYGHNAQVVDIAISPDGRYVASASEDGTARLWNVAGGQQMRDLAGHRNLISSVAFTAGGQQVITGSTDTIKFWDSATGRELRSIAVPEKDREGRLTLSEDGKIYTTGGAVNQPKTGFLSGFTGMGDIFRPLKIMDVASGRELMSYKTEVGSPYAAYVLSPDSRLLAVRSAKFKDGMNQESVRVFDTQSGREISNFKIPGAGGAHAMSPLAISGNGKWLAAQGEVDASLKVPVYVFDIVSKKLVRQFSTSSVFMPSLSIDSMSFVSSPFAFSPDAKVLALGGSSSIQLWEPDTGKELRSLRTHLKPGATTDASMDAQWRESMKAQGIKEQDASMFQMSADIMDSMMDEDGMFSEVVGMVGNTPGLAGLARQTLREESIQFSPDGKWLVTQGSEHVRTWDFSAGNLQTPTHQLIPPVGISADSQFYASVEMDAQELMKGNTISYLVLRNRETRTEIARSKWSDAAPIDIVFGPDNSWIAVYVGNEIRILDSKALSVQRKFPISNTGQVFLFSENARYFAVGGKPASAAPVASSGDQGTPMMGIDPKMLEQMTKMMGKKMDRKEMEKIQKQMEKMMKGQKPVAVEEPGPEELLKPSDYTIQIFDMQSGKQIQSVDVESIVHDLSKDGPISMPLGAASRDLHRMKFSKDGRFLAVEDLDQQYPSVKIYESATARRLSSIPVSRKRAVSRGNTMNLFQQKRIRPTFAFHPDGSTIAVSAQEGGYAVNLWDVATGKQLKTFPHLSRVDALTFHPNGKFLVTRMRDRSVNVWELSGGSLIATMMEFPGLYFTTEWLVATPDGLFDGSPAAWNQIMWRFSRGIFDLAPVETFFNDFYYPGLMMEIFEPNRPRAPRNLSQLDRRQPVVKLISSATGSSRDAVVQIQVAEAPADGNHTSGSGVQDVRLFRNGTLLKVWRGDVLQGQSSRTLETTVKVMSDDNRFVAYAFNRDNVKSADSTLVIRGDESLKQKGTAYIVAIGINQYENANFNLKYAVADAKEFSESLQRSQQALQKFEKVQVVSLFDQDATKEKIIASLKAFAATGAMAAEPEDALIIYYAGHGTAEKSRFYMVPHDLGYTGPRDQMDNAAFQTIVNRGISDEELEVILETVSAGRILLVIDACNSGQALESQERRRGPMNAKGLAQLAYEKGMYILAAAQGYQAALEAARLGHGYLTFALVEEGVKAKSADHLPQDGTVMIREWLNYASSRVPEMQAEKMQEARLLKHEVAFVDGEEKNPEIRQRSVQQPRVFYRREMEADPLVILK